MSSKETVGKIFLVALLLCVVCAVIVSTAAVGLRPKQEFNKKLDKKKNILLAAGIYEDGIDINKTYDEKIRAKVVELETGEYSKISPDSYDQRQAAKDSALSIKIPANLDLGGIGRRAKNASIYLVVDAKDKITRFIFPVHGKGLWSTLYGFLALDTDLVTIRGLTFYEHAETPGLGGEVDNPSWKAQWDGKKAYDPNLTLSIKVIKGKVDTSSKGAEYQVDGLSGATITARGVSDLLRYWLGDNGYGPYISKIRKELNKG